MTPEQRSKIANAARDLCRDFLRWQRDMDRFTAALVAVGGANTPGVGQAVTQGLGTPELREAWQTMQTRLTATGETQEPTR